MDAPADRQPNPRRHLPAALVAALALAPLLAACASMGGATPREGLRDAARLEAGQTLDAAPLAAESWPRADWWKDLDDPQLDALIAEALDGNPGMKAAQARVREAVATAQVAGAVLAPQVSTDAGFTRLRYPEFGLVPPPLNGSWNTQAQWEATLGYNPDLWGGNRAAHAAALDDARALQVDHYAARLALSVDVARAYVDLDRAWRQLDVEQRTLAEREQVYRLTQDRFDAGVDTRLAVKQAESRLPATRERMAQLQEQVEQAQARISALLGKGPDRGRSIGRPAAQGLASIGLPSRVPAVLLGRRPDLVAARWRVEAAGRRIDAARAQFYPNIDLQAFAGLQSIGLSNFLQAASRTVGIGPAVTLPIFDGGRLRGNLQAREAGYDIAVDQYNEALADALRDVADQLSASRSVGEQRRQQVLALATAQEAFDLAMLRFRDGIGNYLDVLSAESDLLAQQGLDVDLHARSLQISIDLARALGGGFEPAPESQLAKENGNG